ncbi:hypothetical protein [uncultured Marinobacter sp.]|uniref:hypothetical protein n=1 Tax=uncultured Marinobacter sp. TaxID=187379 RepID=UPI0026308DE0|nr:hypothetical protein [uncultured Marinobacter sp.]
MADQQLLKILQPLIDQESLPSSYVRTVEQTIVPLARHVQALVRTGKQPIIVGIHGAQGTGKSTLTLFLKEILQAVYDCRTVNFSLDDIYLTRAEREHLADTVHPLLATRGVPGTHDLALGQKLINQLTQAGPTDRTPVPVFDKSMDDRSPKELWPEFEGRPDVVLVEGWCVAATPANNPDELAAPVNTLEREEDPQGIWRRYVDECLQGAYRTFFDQLDTLIMLQAPSMDCVLEWRTLQEHKLARRQGGAPEEGKNPKTLRIMNDDQVARFIMHYERITRRCLAELPSRADVVIAVAEDHSLGLPSFRKVDGDMP